MKCAAYCVIRRPNELVAHENYIVYFDQNEDQCTVTIHSVVHVAR